MSVDYSRFPYSSPPRPIPLVHWKAGAGEALCPDNAWPGELLVTDEAEVTCPECIEWRHA